MGFVVDYGSHVPAHNIISFEALWKNVRPGGIYIVEDIESSYYPTGNMYGYKYNSGILANPPLNALSRFRQYVDVVNRGYMGTTGPKYSLFEGDHSIVEIVFVRNMIFVKKAIKGIDSGEKPYEDYPYHMHRGPGLIRSMWKKHYWLCSKSSRKCWTNGTQKMIK